MDEIFMNRSACFEGKTDLSSYYYTCHLSSTPAHTLTLTLLKSIAKSFSKQEERLELKQFLQQLPNAVSTSCKENEERWKVGKHEVRREAETL